MVWFSLWVREAPGSNPGWARFFCFCFNFKFLKHISVITFQTYANVISKSNKKQKRCILQHMAWFSIYYIVSMPTHDNELVWRFVETLNNRNEKHDIFNLITMQIKLIVNSLYKHLFFIGIEWTKKISKGLQYNFGRNNCFKPKSIKTSKGS